MADDIGKALDLVIGFAQIGGALVDGSLEIEIVVAQPASASSRARDERRTRKIEMPASTTTSPDPIPVTTPPASALRSALVVRSTNRRSSSARIWPARSSMCFIASRPMPSRTHRGGVIRGVAPVPVPSCRGIRLCAGLRSPHYFLRRRRWSGLSLVNWLKPRQCRCNARQLPRNRSGIPAATSKDSRAARFRRGAICRERALSGFRLQRCGRPSAHPPAPG